MTGINDPFGGPYWTGDKMRSDNHMTPNEIKLRQASERAKQRRMEHAKETRLLYKLIIILACVIVGLVIMLYTT